MKLSPYSEYGWNERAGRYINQSTGRFVPFKAVKLEMEAVMTASAANVEAVSRRLVDGSASLAEWQLVMEREIKSSQVAMSAAAKGGWAQMTPSDWGWTGAQVKKQYEYLRNFAAQIANGTQKLDGRLVQRAKLYALAGRATFEEMRRRVGRNRGAVEERRVLMPGAEHCQPNDARGTPGCAELALKGWQPVGTLPPIGAATCVTHCLCFFEMRDGEGAKL